MHGNPLDSALISITGIERVCQSGSSTDESRYKLSLSVGMARFDPKRPVSLGKLISMADEAVYEHKKNRPKLTAP